MKDNYELIDDRRACQYEFHIGGHVAKVEYIKSLNGIMYLTYTEVPPDLKGHRIGSLLVEKVLADVERQKLRLVPLCPFVAIYIQKHPEWKRLLQEGFQVD